MGGFSGGLHVAAEPRNVGLHASAGEDVAGEVTVTALGAAERDGQVETGGHIFIIAGLTNCRMENSDRTSSRGPALYNDANAATSGDHRHGLAQPERQWQSGVLPRTA